MLAETHDLLVTVEENARMGGAGSAVLESLAQQGLKSVVEVLGIPDTYIEHDSPTQQHVVAGTLRTDYDQGVRALSV